VALPWSGGSFFIVYDQKQISLKDCCNKATTLELYPLTYPKRNDLKTMIVGVFQSTHPNAGKVQVWLIWITAIILIIFSGITYRAIASLIVDTAINLPLPLKTLPVVIGDWTGMEMSIPTTTREYMEANFADDYVSRRYINSQNQTWIDLYIVYCASKPGGMLDSR
jgi:hypothetical protein